MRIKVRKELAELMGLKTLEKFGFTEMSWTHREAQQCDLALLSSKQLDELEEIATKLHGKHGTTGVAKGVVHIMHNIQVWRRAIKGSDHQKARTALQMASFLKLYLQKVPGHRIYEQNGELWLPYYVESIAYHEKVSTRDGVIPAYVSIRLVYEELGGRDKYIITESEPELRGISAPMLLANHDLHIETPEMRATYIHEREKFMDLQPQVGLQLEMMGTGTDDLDGNDDDDHSWRWTPTIYALGTAAERSRAVVDVFNEKPKSENSREDKITVDPMFWDRKSVSTDDDDDDGVDYDDDGRRVVEIPIHPFLAVFDLQRHLRLRVHISNVEVHEYDRHLSDKLVLPEHLKALVSLLIEHRSGGFQDIIKGKSGGAVVLLAGAPGTGKTLTAEVYAEAEGRALYSVQCSQLGVKPEELEAELLKCFMRCGRWNAVMLLDEADVYVHTRGNDLQQNAVVGVFLRVLEYQSAVLFLTTNRADDVDDAIASRCIAKLDYTIPSASDEGKIWAILAESSGVKLSASTIKEIIKAHPALSGRDVKNLLKLAMLQSKGEAITPKSIDFVRQFKPTKDIVPADFH